MANLIGNNAPKESEYRIRIDTQDAQTQVNKLGSAAADSVKKFENCTKAAGLMMGAFQSAAAITNLMGRESEATAEAIAKMQNVMAITQGLRSISEGARAFQELDIAAKIAGKGMGTFRKALIATGLGALVVVLGSIIANWDEFTESIGISTEAMNRVKDVFNGVMQVIKNGTAGLAKSLAKLVRGDFSGAWQELQSGLEVAAAYTEGFNKREQAAADEREQVVAAAADEREQVAAELYNSLLEKYKDYGKSEREILNETYKSELKIAGNNGELRKKITAKYNEAIAALNKADAEKQAAQDKQNAEAAAKARENELTALANNLTEQMATLDDMYMSGKISHDEYLKQKQDADDAYERDYIDMLTRLLQTEGIGTDERIALMEKLNAAREKMIKKSVAAIEVEQVAAERTAQTMETLANGANAFGGALNDMFSAIAGTMDESSEEYRALMITQAVVTTLLGVVNAISSAMSPSNAWLTGAGQIALAATMSAAVVASGAASIASMKSANVNTNVGGGSNVSAAAVSAMQTPVLQTQQVTGDSAATETQVYVTETDITRAQNTRNRNKTRVTF